LKKKSVQCSIQPAVPVEAKCTECHWTVWLEQLVLNLRNWEEKKGEGRGLRTLRSPSLPRPAFTRILRSRSKQYYCYTILHLYTYNNTCIYIQYCIHIHTILHLYTYTTLHFYTYNTTLYYTILHYTVLCYIIL